MREVWLGPNRRAIQIAMIVPGFLMAVGIVSLLLFWNHNRPGWMIAGGVVAGLGLLMLLSLLWMLRTPRLALEDDHLLVYLGTPTPYRVPIQFVEVCFLGQAPSGMPKRLWDEAREPSESTTVVVRIADAAKQWQQRPVRPAFGQWCDGYIIVRGTWSELIDGDRVMHINNRLRDIHRQRQANPSAKESS